MLGVMLLLLFAGSSGCRNADHATSAVPSELAGLSARELEKIVVQPNLNYSPYSETQYHATVTGRWVIAENASVVSTN